MSRRPCCLARHPSRREVTCTREPGHPGGHLEGGVYWQAGPRRRSGDIDQPERERRQADRLMRLADAIGVLR